MSSAVETVAFVQAKRDLEDRILASPMEPWVLRLPPFMEAWLALIGSSLPLRGEPHATVGRPSPFLRRSRSLTGSSVEDRGVMLIPGDPGHRHAFISTNAVARACVEAVLRDAAPAEPLEVAGPEVLSWRDVAAIFEKVLQRRVRLTATPSLVYRVAGAGLGPIATVPAATMGLNYYMSAIETPWTNAGGGLLEPSSLITVEEFLRAKAALPPALPAVA